MRIRKPRSPAGAWWRRVTWNVAFSIRQDEGGEPVVFVFRGAWHGLLQRVFDHMRGVMLSQYEITEEEMPCVLPHRCHRQLCVEVSGRDFLCQSTDTWVVLIERYLQRTVPCRVKYFPKYDRFLNL